MTMRKLGLIASLALMSSLASAQDMSKDMSKYPDWSGQWNRPRGAGIQWDPSKRPGLAQQPPLTPEYQAIYEASLADQANGGQGNDPVYRCYPGGMPRVMNGVFGWEIIISPNVTYMLFDYSTPRRIYT